MTRAGTRGSRAPTLGFLPRSVTWYPWLPMAAFEIPFAVLLLANRVSAPRTESVEVR